MTQNFMLNLYFILHINTANIRSYSSWYRGGGWVKLPVMLTRRGSARKDNLFQALGLIKWYRIS